MSTNDSNESSGTEGQNTIKVFVGNLRFKTTPETLKEVFAAHGNVLSANIIYRGTRSKGYGFVEYGTLEEAEAAIAKLNGTEIDEREVSVELANPREVSEEKKPAGKKRKPRRRNRNASQQEGEGASGDAEQDNGRDKRDGPQLNADGHLHTSNACFIANLPFSLESDALKELFVEFGVSTARVARRRTGKSKGYGFVEMQTAEGQQNAIAQMDGKEVDGRVISVTAAKPLEAGESSSDE